MLYNLHAIGAIAISPNNQDPSQILQILTPKELQVLEHLRRGMTKKLIGTLLGISEYTVKKHMDNASERLKDGFGLSHNEALCSAYGLEIGF